MDELLTQLQDLIEQWDLDARDRHRDGMTASAEAIRDCRRELVAVIKQHARRVSGD